METKSFIINKRALFVPLFMHEFFYITIRAQDTLKNIPELSLPMASEKLVIAHNMTDIIRFRYHDLEDSCDPRYYPAKGNITEPLGGMVQVNVIAEKYLKDSTLEQTVRFEMRTAMHAELMDSSSIILSVKEVRMTK